MLAALPEEELEAKLSQMDFASRTPRTIGDAGELRLEVRRTRQRGYATDDRENEPLGACVAAAIVGADGRLVGAISVAGPHFRIRDHFEAFGMAARETAQEIARELGAGGLALPSHGPRAPPEPAPAPAGRAGQLRGRLRSPTHQARRPLETAMRVAVLVADMFEEPELLYPYYRLLEAGHRAILVGSAAQEYKGKHGYPVRAEVAAGDLRAADLDAMVIPGASAPTASAWTRTWLP